MNSTTKKQSKVVARKRTVTVKKAAVTKKTSAKAPATVRRTVAKSSGKAPVRRRPRSGAAKVIVGQLIESPLDYAIPLMASVIPETEPVAVLETVPERKNRDGAGNARKMGTTTAVLMAVCVAALVVVASIALGTSDRPAGGSRNQIMEPTGSESAEPSTARLAEPVSVPDLKYSIRPAAGVLSSKSGSAVPQDVSWANGVIQERMNRIAGLYSMLRSSGPALTGTLAAHLEIEPDGHVGRAWLETDSINNVEFSQKVIRELITARFIPTGIAQPVGLIVPIGFGAAGTRLMTVAAHNAKMPGDAAVLENDAVAGVSSETAERNS